MKKRSRAIDLSMKKRAIDLSMKKRAIALLSNSQDNHSEFLVSVDVALRK
ncbi:MAG: hypothetical protein JGK24_24455 [Microcoleus sp. PH2017_29_MFU_D_A]|nr:MULTISPECIES: hypothetical protein [unclassified Microcoleus]MCC3427673.1 hypothetical protein [Microcoleus sp. PH2017_01_SCD_O_A]MCC3509274.1 hypothetical protein [Microcoleus sp. PH2017_17_BER_D_A]MCC3518829.1 hypothetical protein [Microcoleus sp. PH2017_18_LLB_O_A]MCC3454073.1 hypothetical protein [Microcoleus sp. PH2017_08_TRC_O_A]MCC3606290.1 hypothetical protein [Microcoleus sp. PH2017_29_MFU_D_A]